MTDNKPIIIDDIDVSECEHLYRKIDCLAHIDFSECCEGYNPSYGYCPNIPNCNYKQLKRKEQECETLASQLDFEVQKKECLEQECEELKKDLHQNFKEKDKLHLIIDRLLEASGYDANTASAEEFEDVYKSMCYEKQQLDQLKAELEQEKALKETYLACYKTKHEDIEGVLFKLKQAIAEIKEIAEKISLPMGTGKSGNRVILAKTILQKVSEVLND